MCRKVYRFKSCRGHHPSASRFKTGNRGVFVIDFVAPWEQVWGIEPFNLFSLVGEIMDNKELAARIDHTCLKPEATPDDIRKLCAEASQYGFHSVCVNSVYVSLAVRELERSSVTVCSTVGFPLGAMPSRVKVDEAIYAIFYGADELDMVLPVGLVISGDYPMVGGDVWLVAEEAHRHGVILKVIIETGLLTDEQKIKTSELALAAGADFVKTCTGFAKGQATVEDIKLMREVVGDRCRIKASGGIRDRETAIAMIEAGADRLGCSASVAIVTGK
jgi:deoxyribose-phosphate aldolase